MKNCSFSKMNTTIRICSVDRSTMVHGVPTPQYILLKECRGWYGGTTAVRYDGALGKSEETADKTAYSENRVMIRIRAIRGFEVLKSHYIIRGGTVEESQVEGEEDVKLVVGGEVYDILNAEDLEGRKLYTDILCVSRQPTVAGY